MPPSTSDDGGGGDAYDDVQTVATTKAQARKWILEHDTKVAVPPQFAAAAAVRPHIYTMALTSLL